MKLSNYIMDLGRTVAFHPNLKWVTGSTTATLFLCQLLYWTSKSKHDGWIYKTNYEIEEETGLSYYEQKTARSKLIELDIIEEEFKRWDRTNRYRVKQDVLNTLWEDVIGKKSMPNRGDKGETAAENDTMQPAVDLRTYQNPDLHPEHSVSRTDAVKKGDLVDAYVDFSKEAGVQKENAKNSIREKLSTKLHVYIDAKKWEKLIDFIYVRETKYNEPVEKFITWLLENNPNSTYWTPDKLIMQYPQAFAEDRNKPREDFVEKLPEKKEEDFVPMPEYVKHKKHLT